ncbi:TRAF3-interacting protein 1 isoform X1 [Ascaphus truei]|uniref:TRAF3-interacting protein 1 isoform X1 n=1 Tax=Ascaphus truei TaxID=8439 RepID=UPI003F597268
MDPSVLRRTQESLGKVIRKPPLTDKLLGKPPFRYLHDILSEVIRTTGFFKGLYTESEMKSDNVKDKDAKIIFLQKAIDVVVLVAGESLAVKPARVVAGHEPERTNELLQAIGKCCLNKLSSEDAVRRVLAGEKPDLKVKPPSSSKSQDKENREAKDEERKGHREKEDRRESEIRERSASRDRKDGQQLKEEERKPSEREGERKSERDRPVEAETLREGEKNDKERSRVKESRSEPEKDRSREKRRERRSEGGRGKEREKDRTRDRENGKERDRNPEKERNRERDLEQEKKRERGREDEHRRDRGREEEKPREQERAERKPKGSEDSLSKKTSEASVKESKSAADKELTSPTKAARPSASKLRERRPVRPGGEGSLQYSSLNRPQAARRKEVPKKATAAESVIEAKAASLLDRKAQKPLPLKKTVLDVSVTAEREILSQERTAKVTDEKTVTCSGERADREIPAQNIAVITGDSASDGEGEAAKPLISENGEISDEFPPHVTQRRIPRPGSARPAPPRVKRQGSSEAPLPERFSSGKAVSSVIVDKQKEEDDDDDEFVVVDAPPRLPEMPKMEMDRELDLAGDEKHGGLVKKILETKKDYETQLVAVSKEKPLLSETGRRKEKELVVKEIERLRGSTQTLCRSALPLGKIMDYIQEDMDAMQNELQTWRSENRQHAEVLLREQSVTDTAVVPLKAELAELEQLIKEQQDKICTVKGNILRNEDKIQKMVQSINVTSRA